MTPKEFERSHPRDLLDILTLALEMTADSYDSETPEYWVWSLFVQLDKAGYCFAKKRNNSPQYELICYAGSADLDRAYWLRSKYSAVHPPRLLPSSGVKR